MDVVLVVGDVLELMALSAEAQLVALSHPLRRVAAEDVEETRFGELVG